MTRTFSYISPRNHTMPHNRSTAEVITESYYDSSDADRFYETVWGGEDIHIGLYEPGTSIIDASKNTVQAMAACIENLDSEKKVLDLGSGYGGSARYLAGKYGCEVTCLNLSEVQNTRNRFLNKEQGFADKIRVMHGSFESIPFDDSSFDIVWSQDAFLHSNRREQVVQEIKRVLKPGGELIFTDPMQADDCPDGVLQPVYDRLNLKSLASFKFYRNELLASSFEENQVRDLTHQLRVHYATVREDLQSRYRELTGSISTDYMDRMLVGLDNWVNAADKGYLAWGILYFRKKSA